MESVISDSLSIYQGGYKNQKCFMICPSTVAGYKDLFPNGTKSKSDFVKDIPSDILICVLIALNHELNSHEERFEHGQVMVALVGEFALNDKIA